MTSPSLEHDDDQRSPLFLTSRQTSPAPATGPATPSSTPPSSSPHPLDDPTSPQLGDRLELDAGASASPRRSSGERGRKAPKWLRELGRGVVEAAGKVAHVVLTSRGSAERDFGLWLPDDDDVENIAEPAARLAARRVPDVVSDNPDATDLAELAAALLGYVTKNLADRRDLRDVPAPDVVDGEVDQVVDEHPAPAAPATNLDEQPAAAPVSFARSFLAGRGGVPVDDLVDSPVDYDGRGAE